MQLQPGSFYAAKGHISYDQERRDLFRYDDYVPKLVAALASNSDFTSRATLGNVGPNPVMAIYATTSPVPQDRAQLLLFEAVGGILIMSVASWVELIAHGGASGALGLATDWRALEVEFVFQATRSYSDADIRRPIALCLTKAFADSNGRPQSNLASLLESGAYSSVFSLRVEAIPALRAALSPPPLERHIGIESRTQIQLSRGFAPPTQPIQPMQPVPPVPATGRCPSPATGTLPNCTCPGETYWFTDRCRCPDPNMAQSVVGGRTTCPCAAGQRAGSGRTASCQGPGIVLYQPQSPAAAGGGGWKWIAAGAGLAGVLGVLYYATREKHEPTGYSGARRNPPDGQVYVGLVRHGEVWVPTVFRQGIPQMSYPSSGGMDREQAKGAAKKLAQHYRVEYVELYDPADRYNRD
jgi:hypothetical protein